MGRLLDGTCLALQQKITLRAQLSPSQG